MANKLVILGAGESGIGAAILGKKQGYDVFVSDKGEIKEFHKKELEALGVDYESGQHTEARILESDEVIKSPGIPTQAPLVQQLMAKGIPVISEIEFAARYTKAYLIAITGTNGKTTTTSLIYHMLKKADLNVGLAGNIGNSFAREVAEQQFDYYVLEISSFQLDHMYNFRANVGVLTNITPDHLDRYDYELNNYIKAKLRMLQNQTAEDYFIYCADDPLTTAHFDPHAHPALSIPFSLDKSYHPGAWLLDGSMHVNIHPEQSKAFHMFQNEMSLKGRHNAYNSMAAAIVGEALNIRKEIIRESLTDFVNVEHRLETCGKIHGIEFINDSKATNVNSAWYALESMDTPVVWIAGGVDKGNDYNILRALVKDKVRIIVCLGLDNRKIHEAFANDVDMIVNTTSMQECVHVAYKLANKGDTVLLSPASASFDLFQNYEDRGRQFKKAVKNL